MSYTAPLRDMRFAMKELAGLDEVLALPGCEDLSEETVQAVLEEAARLCSEVIAPLNAEGDRHPAQWRDGEVQASPGFAQAFRQFVAGGWQGIVHPVEYGGQGLPKLVATPCLEMLCASNLSFATCPTLTDGVIEALLIAGSEEQRRAYLPKLVAGEWTGTMNLTEPQAGSDLSLIRTRAELWTDGSYRLFGTKIFITWGEHDLANNILHLVLARIPGAPEGVKGISLFLVPKVLDDGGGAPARRNDVRCISIEHKLGLKASPTAVLQFGDEQGATGYLVGEPGRGLEYMFVMMNAARYIVGLQGIGLSDRAYQKALAYAKERVQSRPVDRSTNGPVPIVRHPDVRRMLAIMRALSEASRALACVTAAHHDIAQRHADPAVRERNRALHDFLVPIVKGWSTELALEVTSLGVQVHGGVGFIEETGAAQYYRDARILPIYEGTTAIQANDLIGRKTLRDGGAVARELLCGVDGTLAKLEVINDAPYRSMYVHLARSRQSFSSALAFVLDRHAQDPDAVFLGGVSYLKLAGLVLGGWQMARAMLVAHAKRAEDTAFYDAKVATGQFYAEHVLPMAAALEIAITAAHAGQGALALHADTL